MSDRSGIRTLGDYDLTQGGARYFAEGKANVAAMPLRNRCKHAVVQCMLEAGHARPRWLDTEDGALLPLVPEEWLDWPTDVKTEWDRACLRACDLVRDRIGWPEGEDKTDG